MADIGKPKAAKKKPAGRTVYQKELQQIKDICSLLKQLSITQQNESKNRRNQDYLELQVHRID